MRRLTVTLVVAGLAVLVPALPADGDDTEVAPEGNSVGAKADVQSGVAPQGAVLLTIDGMKLSEAIKVVRDHDRVQKRAESVRYAPEYIEVFAHAGSYSAGAYRTSTGLLETLEDLEESWNVAHSTPPPSMGKAELSPDRFLELTVDGFRIPSETSAELRDTFHETFIDARPIDRQSIVVSPHRDRNSQPGEPNLTVIEDPMQNYTSDATTRTTSRSVPAGYQFDVPYAGRLYVWIQQGFRVIRDYIIGLGDYGYDGGGIPRAAYEHDFKLIRNNCNELWWADRDNLTGWHANLPGAYLDTTASDPCTVSDFTIGSYFADDLDESVMYDIAVLSNSGFGSSNRARLAAQTGWIHYQSPNCYPHLVNPWCVGILPSPQTIFYVQLPSFRVPLGCIEYFHQRGFQRCTGP